ncbi:MAG: hypothetical protein PHY43_11460 [Verrucomicrobiales bacterium]|nr:hypothetical protein [Verrucomicrobiales bacterium]
MAEFIHSTESQIDGPFLIDRSQMEALDKILQEEWARFKEKRNEMLDQSVEERFKVEHARSYNKEVPSEKLRETIREELQKSYDFRERKECLLYLRNGSVAKVPDFVTAFREPDLQDKEPNGFYAILESCGHSCQIRLTGRRATLEVDVAPKRNQFVQETLMVLKNWQNAVRPPKWQTLWLKTVDFGIAHWMIWILACFLSFTAIEKQAETTQVYTYSQEASQLLNATNLTAENQGKAIQLLLAKTYGYAPQPIKRNFPGWFLILVFCGLAYCVAFSYAPTVSIAIGLGEKKVQFWRKYSRFILITTPTFIFGTFFWPKIEAILKSIL